MLLIVLSRKTLVLIAFSDLVPRSEVQHHVCHFQNCYKLLLRKVKYIKDRVGVWITALLKETCAYFQVQKCI